MTHSKLLRLNGIIIYICIVIILMDFQMPHFEIQNQNWILLHPDTKTCPQGAKNGFWSASFWKPEPKLNTFTPWYKSSARVARSISILSIAFPVKCTLIIRISIMLYHIYSTSWIYRVLFYGKLLLILRGVWLQANIFNSLTRLG